MTERSQPSEGTPHAGYGEIDPEQLALHATDSRVIDVRESSEFEGPLCHIPGAELVPLHDLPAKAADWNKDQSLILVCRSGRRSAEGAALLAARGFKHLLNLRGGMQAYRAAGFPTECGP